jgi:hypothetical protein
MASDGDQTSDARDLGREAALAATLTSLIVAQTGLSQRQFAWLLNKEVINKQSLSMSPQKSLGLDLKGGPA